MVLILLEALLALLLLLLIVWWTMFSGRNKGELPRSDDPAPLDALPPPKSGSDTDSRDKPPPG